ncbi:hypothetical protein KAW65_07790 [candidate division WOR-3 bacterium]|nr:hypothetical protein [candidate division WOR-3 bacterium]
MKYSKFGFPFDIIGKLSTTPEQAEELFGFKMKEGAKGVVLFKRNGRLVIRSWMPHKSYVKTPFRKYAEQKFSVLGKIVKEYKSLINEVWAGDDGKYLFAHSRFMGINMRELGIPPKWLKLRFTIGELPKPKLIRKAIIIEGSKVNLGMSNAEGMEIGICIFERRCLKLHCISPCVYSEPERIKISLSEFGNIKSLKSLYLHIYFKRGKEYSPNAIAILRHG